MNNTEIQINGPQLEKVDCIKFLGVFIDHNISSRNHIAHISIKLSNSTGLIYKTSLVYDATAIYSLSNLIFWLS